MDETMNELISQDKFEYLIKVQCYGTHAIHELNGLGQNGWELTAVNTIQTTTYMYFKRKVS